MLDVLISLTRELSETTGEDDLTVNSAYRSLEEQQEIYDEYRRSRTRHVEKKPGRNDPCPCGKMKADGSRRLKYKECCGRNG